MDAAWSEGEEHMAKLSVNAMIGLWARSAVYSVRQRAGRRGRGLLSGLRLQGCGTSSARGGPIHARWALAQVKTDWLTQRRSAVCYSVCIVRVLGLHCEN